MKSNRNVCCIQGSVLPVGQLNHPQPLRKWKSFLSPHLALVFSLLCLLWLVVSKKYLSSLPADTSSLCPCQPQKKWRCCKLRTVSKCPKWRSGGDVWAVQLMTTLSIPNWRLSVMSFQSKKKNNFNSSNWVPQDQQFWIFKLKCQFWFCLLSVYSALIIPDKYPVSFVVDFLRNGMIEYDTPFSLKQFPLNFNASWFSCHCCRELFSINTHFNIKFHKVKMTVSQC